MDHILKNFTKIGLVEWLKVKALSSNPSTAKQTNKKQRAQKGLGHGSSTSIPA
jgi:hypothetical protein